MPCFIIRQKGSLHYEIDYYFTEYEIRKPAPILLTYLLNTYVIRKIGPIDPTLAKAYPDLLDPLIDLLNAKIEILIAPDLTYFTFQVESLYLLNDAATVYSIMDIIRHDKGVIYQPLWRFKLNEIQPPD